MSTPFISIIIPTRNEELFIGNCLESILLDDYSKDLMEILIVDGMSDDNTQKIIKSFIAVYPMIRIIDNPRKIYPSALNLGINNSRGEIILILGAHATYELNYISKCVKYLIEIKADNVGGVLKTVGLNTSFFGKAISNVLSSSFGVGNSTFRVGSDKIVEVDTVFGGCYPRSTFERIGYFNENLVSSSDMEFNNRLKRSGGKIFLVPEIVATYYTRSTFCKFIRNNIRNGYWAIYPMRFVDYIPVSLRHLIPLFFLMGIIGGIVLSFFAKLFLYILLSTLSLYLIASILASVKFARQGIPNIIPMPILFLLLHISYGIGSIIGLCRVVFHKIF